MLSAWYAAILPTYRTAKLQWKDRLFWEKKIFMNPGAGIVHNYKKWAINNSPLKLKNYKSPTTYVF